MLAPAVIQKLSTGYADTNELVSARYGYGLVTTELRGIHVLRHGGSRAGYGSAIYMAPEHRVAVITIGNRSGAGLGRTAEKALEVMLPLKPPEPQKPSIPLPMTAEEMTRYAGRYTHGSNSLDLIVRDGKLFSKERAGDRAVIKIAENWFEIAGRGGEPAARFKLLLDAQGRGEFVATRMRALRREK